MTRLSEVTDLQRIHERARLYRRNDEAFASWAAGYGVVSHTDLTQVRIYERAQLLVQRGVAPSTTSVFAWLAAADRLANAGMWLVVHMTYANRVRLDGADLAAADFKERPEGHTGGALNMVPAYVGYLAANVLSAQTRGWLMGQGHCVAAIDSVNVLVGNTTPAHASRYDVSDTGLTRLVRDFYSYALSPEGRPASPLGSHVNAHTAGGLIEGGYLGFAELLYAHMPLPGERLVSFLSDGAFEEQRGGDWASRYWRAEDSGYVTPVLIANGRRIDQRTTFAQLGGVAWLRDHLALNGFDPIDIDGRDPAAFAWAILESEDRLHAGGEAVAQGHAHYPIAFPFVIAETEKGYGFVGAGTNRAHNLPLGTNPHHDAEGREAFNAGARKLWVPAHELADAVASLKTHIAQNRVPERDNVFATRAVTLTLPKPQWSDADASPMSAIDATFVDIVRHNPTLRPRVGNPDEMESNRMHATLSLLKHRVTAPEPGSPEALLGGVITALNEEAVVCAALGNKGGLNLVVTYEAFGVKMLGALRQEIIFARHQREAGRAPQWLSVPVVLSSHLWENGKNEQSHQDPTLSEALLMEMSDVSRVVFPADWNSAAAALRAAYATHGEIWTLVVPKQPQPIFFSPQEASELARVGVLRLRGEGTESAQLIAIGAYQLREVLAASQLLQERGIANSVVYVQEPGRLRAPRDAQEAAYVLPTTARDKIFGQPRTRVIVTHGHPEAMLGLLRPLDLGASHTRALGYLNQGGTLDVDGMLRANRCTRDDIVASIGEHT